MRTINLEIEKLWDVWSKGYYFSNNKKVKVLKNVCYHFENKIINFSCEVVLISKEQICLTKINGQEPSNSSGLEYIYNYLENDFSSIEESYKLIYFLLDKYEFCLIPEGKFFSTMVDSIIFKKEGKERTTNFIHISDEYLYLIALSDELYNENKDGYNYDHCGLPQDIVKKVKLTNIVEVDFYAGEVSEEITKFCIMINIYVNTGEIFEYENHGYLDKRIVKFKDILKKAIHRAKYPLKIA